ncbi:ubiquitin interaction motif domain-containing protein [Toxoplasma gondii TgCatPRC2]|uniref:Ubiquitin interaction motif domain-containing protein n=1 Tax=Toxoplasma gondii TgCatPRC2 TaxID=1130821 RepID=A0A151HMS4_TOXGO|nr:ubiquitin interaction motif domain-containing protein [Toxoplasma gondii TgCatPRC2]
MVADQTPHTGSRRRRERSLGRSGDERRSEEDQETPRGRRELRESRGRQRRCLDTPASEEKRRKRDRRRRRRGDTESSESRDEEETQRPKRERRRSEAGRNTRERTVVISDEDEDEELQLALALSASLQDGCECAVPIVAEEERAERDAQVFSAPVRTEKKREEKEEDTRRSQRREEALNIQEKNKSHTVDERRKTSIAEARDRQDSCGLEGGVEASEREEENEKKGVSVADTTRWDWRRRREDEERRREASQRRREAEFQTVRVQESNRLSSDASWERGEKEEETEKVDETSTSDTSSKGKAANASAERRSTVSEESSSSEGEESKKAGRDHEKRRHPGRFNASDTLENRGTVRQGVDHGSVEEVEDDDDEDEDLQLALALSISEQHDVYHQCRLFSPRDPSETGEGDSASFRCKKLQAAPPCGDVSNGRGQISPCASASQASPQESSESKAGVLESSERATNESLQVGLLSAADRRDSSPQSDQRGEATSERDFMSSLSPPISPTEIRQKVPADDCDIPSNLRRRHPEAEQTTAAHASSKTGANADERTAGEAAAAHVTAGNEEGDREATQQVSESEETTAAFEPAQMKRGVPNYKVPTPTEGRFSAVPGVPIEDGSSSVSSPASDVADSDFEPERRRPRRRRKTKEREKLSEEEAAVSESFSDSPCSSLAEEEMSKSPSSDSDAEDVKPKDGRRTTRKLGGGAARAVPARSRSQQTGCANRVKLQPSQQRSASSAEREKSIRSRCQEGGGDGHEGAREREAKSKKGKERKLVKERQRAAEREAAATAACLWKREKLQEACVYIWKVLTNAVASPVPLSFLRDQGRERGAAKSNSRPGGGKLAALLHHAQREEQAKIIPAPFGSMSSVFSPSQNAAPSGQDEAPERAAGDRKDERVFAVANPVDSSCGTTSLCPPGAAAQPV